MNVTNVLDRGSGGAQAPTTESPQPPTRPPEIGQSGGHRWPMAAKVLVVVLALAALLGAAGTVIGFTSDDEPAASTDPLVGQLRNQITALTAERDAATASVTDLESQIATLEARLTTLRDQLRTTQARRDGLIERVGNLDARVAAMTERIGTMSQRIDTLRGRVATLADQRDGAKATVAELQGQLTAARQQAAAAIAQRDALAKLFPISFDGSVVIGDVAGTYRLGLKQVYCSGLTSCGTAPAITSAKLTATSQDFLRLTMGSLIDANLYRIEGGLHSVVQSTTAVPACNGAARTAHVTVTLYPHGFELAKDGSVAVTSMAGGVTIESPATGSCPAVLAFYGAELTPAS